MKKEKLIFNGRLLRLYSKKERLPNKNIVELEIIKHPGAVLIVPFLSVDKIIMIRQWRPVIKRYIWELPAGTLKPKESLLKCAQRELAEEIGYFANNIKRIGHIYPAPGYTTEDIIIFKAEKLEKAKSKKEDDEIIRTKVLTKKEIKRIFKSSKITDAKTICALKLAGII